MKNRERYFKGTVGIALALSISATSRALADPSCGDTLTADVTLSADLTCTNPGYDGLIIGGNGVTLDLNGHTITGPGIVGIRIVGANATVINTAKRPGTIKGFGYGVYLNPTQGARVVRLTLTGNGKGIEAGFAHSNIISGNVISGNSQDGIRLGASSHNWIGGNTVSKNDFGIALADGSDANIVSGNNVSKNRNFGIDVFCGSDSNIILHNSVTKTTAGEAHGIIVRSGSDETKVKGNAANLNAGDGIHVDVGGECQNSDDNVMPINTDIAENTANRNGDDGIEVEIEVDMTSNTTIRDNTANVNGDYGIEAPSTCDGGGNVAKRNNNPEQTMWGC
jgi:parallel beta-helix repeat protein